MRKLTYKVFSCDLAEVPVSAKLPSGKVVDALDKVLMVQLLPVDNVESGTIKLVISDENEEDLSVFQVGHEVSVSFDRKGK